MHRHNEAGFTLLEVMVAFAIAALAISLLYRWRHRRAERHGHGYGKSEEALALARSHIAAVGRGEAISKQETSGVDGDGYSWHLRIRSVASRELTLFGQRPRQRHQTHIGYSLRYRGDGILDRGRAPAWADAGKRGASKCARRKAADAAGFGSSGASGFHAAGNPDRHGVLGL